MKQKSGQLQDSRHLFSARVALAFVLVTIVALAGCVTQDPRLTAALKTVEITDVRVEAAPDVKTGFTPLNGPTSASEVAMAIWAVQDVASRNLKGYPGGTIPARLVVTLHVINVTSTAARVIAGSDSIISGTVRLEDAKTGKLIAEAQNIRGADRGMKGGGLGVVAAVAINAIATTDQNGLALKLATSFTQEIKAWLTPKK